MRLQVFDADYTTDPLKLRVFGKNSDGVYKLVDTEFKPYLYALPEENLEEMREEVEASEFETDQGEKLEPLKVEAVEMQDENQEVEALKVYAEEPAEVPKLKNSLWDLETVQECREFDIPFYRRYLIDRDVRPGDWIEVEGEEKNSKDFEAEIRVKELRPVKSSEEVDWNHLSFDLEVVDDRVVMASLYSESFEKVLSLKDIGLEFVEKVESEEQIVERIVEIVDGREVDILTGYNTDEFDFDVLRRIEEETSVELALGRDGERMKFNRRGRFKGARIKARMHLDLYPFVSHVLSPGLDSETLDLDSVAQELLDMEKDDIEWSEMKNIWENEEELEKFAEYALKDSRLTYLLGEKIYPQILELSKITGLIPFDTCRLTYGQLTENYLLREAHERGKLAKNRPSQKKRNKRDREEAYTGGFVYTPEEGLYEDVAVFDFRSLYPTVMVAHNISPDTFNIEECSEEFNIDELNYSFCQDKQGFFPELVEDLVSSRYTIKSEMKDLDEETERYTDLYNRQQAQKILANSFYGYLGYSGARWYSRESAEATTFLGRKYIQETIEKAKERGFEMVYGDTDSVMLRKDNLEEELDEFVEEVNSDLPRFMELEFEGLFKRGFFTSKESGEGAKKKYALIDEDGNLKITGFEQVRRDWSPVAKQTQKKVLRKVLEDEVEEAAEEVKSTIEALQNGEIDVEDLRIYTTLTKPPEEYNSTAPHVEAVKKAEKRGDDIEAETTVGYVITRGGKSISDSAELVKYADSYEAEYYIDNQVIPVALRVLKVFGYTEEELKGKGRQSGLNRF
ncbi:MAG: DNA-directed DNA polymerase [Candidatus Nanohaloarchaea archaeon]